MGRRLEEEHLDVLKTWGAGLSAGAREELRAAGKAIMILIDEIELLQVDVWNARGLQQESVQEVSTTESLTATLHDRLTMSQAASTER